MSLEGSIEIKGKGALAWVKKNEEGFIDLVFYDGEHNELVLSVDSGCLTSMAETLQEFQRSGKAKNQAKGTGEITSALRFHFSQEPLSLKADFFGELDFPLLSLAGKMASVGLTLNAKQARGLRESCQSVLEIFGTIDKLESGKELSPDTT